MYRERTYHAPAGLPFLIIHLLILAAAGLGSFLTATTQGLWASLIGFGLIPLLCFAFKGYLVINPNEGVVLQLFGQYRGTAKEEGLRWVNPLLTRAKISLRVRTFESAKLKVNDLDGNPIEIAAVITWKVVDTAEAVFNVNAFESFVTIQSEAALRNLATHFPYDAHDDEKISLRGHTDVIAGKLKVEVDQRLAAAGVEILEARISHLAYAPEIAQAMLQRQQAGAIIAARTRIVEGAVGMVEMALDRLDERGKVHLDEERKAAMVSNLLVVLCSERAAQPVVNAGSLYH